MGLVRYFLIRAGRDWLVTLDGQVMARCPTRTQALERAVVMADLMGSMHHDADVMAELEPCQPLELIWTYGQDAPRRPRQKLLPPAQSPSGHLRLVQRGEAAS